MTTTSSGGTNMQTFINRIASTMSPLLGTGGVGVCPACVTASAALLSWLGLGFLIPIWRPIALVLLALGAVGFIADLTRHRNALPLILLLVGGWLLYVGRYVFGGPELTGWQIWLPGAVLTIMAVILNRRQFRHLRIQEDSSASSAHLRATDNKNE